MTTVKCVKIAGSSCAAKLALALSTTFVPNHHVILTRLTKWNIGIATSVSAYGYVADASCDVVVVADDDILLLAKWCF